MNEWVRILQDAEDKWIAVATSRSLAAREVNYCYERDVYKANYILSTYGYDDYLKFVERCPHIGQICKKEECLYATE